MLNLLLMRHAKSDRDEAGQADHERRLTERGRRDAGRMAQHLATQGLVPAVILCSSARRAHETANSLMEVWPSVPELLSYNDLYQSDVDTFLKRLANVQPNNATPIMIIGHDPEMESAVRKLTGVSQEFSTAAVACIEFGIADWTQVAGTPGKLRAFWKPRELA